MELVELKKEIERLQNIVALEEFKKHYDKSESYRIIDDLTYQPSESYIKAQQLLNEEYNGCVSAKIDKLGSVTLIEDCEHEILGKTQRVIAYIPAKVDLPYSYVMGKKVGKKVARNILEKYGMSL